MNIIDEEKAKVEYYQKIIDYWRKKLEEKSTKITQMGRIARTSVDGNELYSSLYWRMDNEFDKMREGIWFMEDALKDLKTKIKEEEERTSIQLTDINNNTTNIPLTAEMLNATIQSLSNDAYVHYVSNRPRYIDDERPTN